MQKQVIRRIPMGLIHHHFIFTVTLCTDLYDLHVELSMPFRRARH
jgi:hypothetical protein